MITVSVRCERDGQTEYGDASRVSWAQSHGVAAWTFCGFCGSRLVFPTI